jgi:DNA-binding CsgD family transcriptional regulator
MSSESVYPNAELTPRETEVLERLANGMSSWAIGAELRLTSNAVNASLESILLKLGVHSLSEAVVRYFRPEPDADVGIRIPLRRLQADDREVLRRWLAADQEDRESIACEALKRRTESGDVLAQFVDTLTSQPDQHERFRRVLRQIDDEGPYRHSGEFGP